jgi:hypothetical protein
LKPARALLLALVAAALSAGCKDACETAIDHLDGCGLNSLPASSGADAGADAGVDAGAMTTDPDPATTCTGVLECDARCISDASCEDLVKKDPHGQYQLCLEQCASATR